MLVFKIAMIVLMLSALRFALPAFAVPVVMRRVNNVERHDIWEIVKATAFIVLPMAYLGQGESSPVIWLGFGISMLGYYLIKWVLIINAYPNQPDF